MPFVNDSRLKGYLGPNESPQPLSDKGWEDFLHDIVAGVTGLDPTLVRPRWQVEPANLPTIGSDWAAFGTVDTQVDFDPAIIHVDTGGPTGLGYDMLQEHEIDTILCSFYGENAVRYASMFRRGLYVSQNRAVLRENGVGLVETTAFQHAPELIRNLWVQRVDTNMVLRREIRYNYNVCDIVRAQGPIEANDWGNRVLYTDFDTDEVLP